MPFANIGGMADTTDKADLDQAQLGNKTALALQSLGKVRDVGPDARLEAKAPTKPQCSSVARNRSVLVPAGVPEPCAALSTAPGVADRIESNCHPATAADPDAQAGAERMQVGACRKERCGVVLLYPKQKGKSAATETFTGIEQFIVRQPASPDAVVVNVPSRGLKRASCSTECEVAESLVIFVIG